MLRAILLLLLLRCPRGGLGERSLGGPAQVRFLAQTFHHVLHWEPGANYTAAEARYDVQYKRYGNFSWTPLPHCTRTPSLSCDLSRQTWSPQHRYYARVRVAMGNRTSSWAQASSPFSPKEATPQLASASFSVSGNRIHVALQLPVCSWANVTFEDIHGPWMNYYVHVWGASDVHQFVHVGPSLEFDLPPLLWGEQYCVSVEPRVSAQPNPGKWTEQQCVSIPPLEGQATATVLPTFALLSLAALSTLGTAWAWLYVKKPTKTPTVLKSLLKTGSPWLPSAPPAVGAKDVVLCVEADSVQHLSLSLKDGPQPGCLSAPSAGAAAPPLPQSPWWLALWAGSEAGRLERQETADSSGCSTDSGICLQELSGSLSHPLGSHLEGGGAQEGSCLGLGLPPVLSSGKTEVLALAAEGRWKPADPPQAPPSGYQRQSGSPRTLPSTDETAHSQPGPARGYLKQPSFAGPRT
ncbi:hypothetical protein lerEdw1_010047 [Lerista edwardsae]|nr:hypothetical protein lerEdw1_010047 [Lerista edwardsae]